MDELWPTVSCTTLKELKAGFSSWGIGARKTTHKTSVVEGAIKLQVVLLEAVNQLCLINYLIRQDPIVLPSFVTTHKTNIQWLCIFTCVIITLIPPGTNYGTLAIQHYWVFPTSGQHTRSTSKTWINKTQQSWEGSGKSLLFLFTDEKQTCARPLMHAAEMNNRVKLRHVYIVCVCAYIYTHTMDIHTCKYIYTKQLSRNMQEISELETWYAYKKNIYI